RKTQLCAGVDEDLGCWIWTMILGIRDAQGSSMSRQRVRFILLILELLEVGKTVLISPTVATLVRPVVIVQRVPAHMHHDVQVAASAWQPPARFVRLAPFQTRLGHTYVIPVDLRPQ